MQEITRPIHTSTVDNNNFLRKNSVILQFVSFNKLFKLFIILLCTSIILISFQYYKSTTDHEKNEKSIQSSQIKVMVQNINQEHHTFQINRSQINTINNNNQEQQFHHLNPSFFSKTQFSDMRSFNDFNNDIISKETDISQSQQKSNKSDSRSLIIQNSELKSFTFSSASLTTLIFINNTFLINFTNSYLPNLTKLIIKQTHFESFENNTFGQLESLEFNNSRLFNNIIPTLDPQLKQLKLINNNISKLNIQKLVSLKSLTIKNNLISQLFLDIISLNDIQLELETLDTLIIFSSQIKSLHKIILPNLKVLQIFNTQLQTLESDNFKRIQKLVLKNNSIAHLQIKNFQKISLLHIYETNLITLLLVDCSFQQLHLVAPLLTTLNLQRMVIPDTNLISAPILQQLEIKNMNNISWIFIDKFLSLKVLSIKEVNIKGKTQSKYQFLESIVMQDVIGIQTFNIYAYQLKTIKLRNISITSIDITKYQKATIQCNISQLYSFTALNNNKINQDTFNNILLFSPNLIKFQIAKTSVMNILIPQQSSLKHIYIGEGFVNKFESRAVLVNLTILQNPLSKISIFNSNLNSLKISVKYPFFNFLQIINSNTPNLLNVNVPYLTQIKMQNLNFVTSEPILSGFEGIKIIQIQHSNIHLLDRRRFPSLLFLNQHDCKNLVIYPNEQKINLKHNTKNKYTNEKSISNSKI